MLDSVGLMEFVMLALVALFVFGPERLPGLAADAGRLLRNLRQMAKGVTDDLKTELGPEMSDLDLRSLHPRKFVQKHLFEDEDEVAPAAPKATPASSASRPAPGTLNPEERPPYDPDAT